MMLEFEKNCTILVRFEAGIPPASVTDLQKRMEDAKSTVKSKALEDTILWMIQGETYNKLLMTVIRYLVPSSDHRIKKLLQIYWEIVDKCKPDGTLKEEMILVCNNLLQDLTHPNEYIRGSTLRLLCKIRYMKILEPLIETILKNLFHRHSYVRRNAVMCVASITKSFGMDVIPTAVEEIYKLLLTETDLSTKRNAFAMLAQNDVDKALTFVLSVKDSVTGLGDIFQLAVLELSRKACRISPDNKASLLRIIINLVEGCPPAVSYEGAAALVALSSSPVALKTASQAYINLLCCQSDNNVRLIVLDRIADIMKRHQHILEFFIMDIFRALKCPSLEVKKRTLEIALRLVTPRTIKDVVSVLRKEIMKSMEADQQSTAETIEYRRMLIKSIHSSSGQYPEVVKSIMELLMDFIIDSDNSTTSEVVLFVRELVAMYPNLRQNILERVTESIPEIQQSRVLRVCFWVLGEYCQEYEMAKTVVDTAANSLAPLPLLREANRNMSRRGEKATIDRESSTPSLLTGGNARVQPSGSGSKGIPTVTDVTPKSRQAPSKKVNVTTRTVILEDGTYGTEDVFEEVDSASTTLQTDSDKKCAPLRNLISSGDVLLSSMISVSLTKLVLRQLDAHVDRQEGTSKPVDNSREVALARKVLYLITCLAKHERDNLQRIGAPDSGNASQDVEVRLNQCIRLLLASLSGDHAKVSKLKAQLFQGCRSSLSRVLAIEKNAAKYEASSLYLPSDDVTIEKLPQPDDLICFRQLREKRGMHLDFFEDEVDEDTPGDLQAAVVSGAIGVAGQDESAIFEQRLAKVQQMTGLADPVYVEAFIQVHHFDLLIELLVINRTSDTLQNVNVELSTHGDLKLVDRPSAATLAAGQSVKSYASTKVQSTETGIIFGYVTYDKRSASDKECLVLNELHIDLLDYIQQSWVGELSFRTMWSEFEWENKININTTITDVGLFLENIMRQTNMTVVGKFGVDNRKTSGGGATRRVGAGGGESEADEKYYESLRELPMFKTLKANASHFFAINLYSRSIFGEDALANLSIEKLPDGKLAGSIRIRSRTQGIALSLGDRMTVIQRTPASTFVKF